MRWARTPATPELLRFAVAFLKTPAKLGTGLVSDIAEAGLLLTDEATREAFVESIIALYEDPDRLDAIIDRFWDQPGYEIVSDLFAFSAQLIIPLFAAGRVARVAKGATLPETPAPRHVDGGGAPVENARDASQEVARSAPEDNATGPDEIVVPNSVDSVAARRAYLNEKFGRTGDLNLDINVRGRQEVATNFFRSQGIPEGKVDSFFTGIDFTQPVEIQTIGSGKRLWQYQAPGAPQGNWYSLNPSIEPKQLGISPYGFNRAAQSVEPKVLNNYLTTEPVSVLRSTSAAVDDFWSVSGQSYPTTGGATQLFSPQKQSFILIQGN